MPPKRHKIKKSVSRKPYKPNIRPFQPAQQSYTKPAAPLFIKQTKTKVGDDSNYKDIFNKHPITFSTIALIFFAMSIFCMVGYVYVWLTSFSGTHNTDGTVTMIVPESRYVVIQVYLVLGAVLAVLSASVQMYHSKTYKNSYLI